MSAKDNRLKQSIGYKIEHNQLTPGIFYMYRGRVYESDAQGRAHHRPDLDTNNIPWTRVYSKETVT